MIDLFTTTYERRTFVPTSRSVQAVLEAVEEKAVEKTK